MSLYLLWSQFIFLNFIFMFYLQVCTCLFLRVPHVCRGQHTVVDPLELALEGPVSTPLWVLGLHPLILYETSTHS